jgi:hypothetical protein
MKEIVIEMQALAKPWLKLKYLSFFVAVDLKGSAGLHTAKNTNKPF